MNASRLGHVQRRALTRLAASRHGLTTADLEGLSAAFTAGARRSCLGNAMRLLEVRGLAAVTGKVPPASADGRGAWLFVWEPTTAGRELAGRCS